MTLTQELLALLIMQLGLGALVASLVGALCSPRDAKARDLLSVWVFVFLFVGFLPISLFYIIIKNLFSFAKACWRNE